MSAKKTCPPIAPFAPGQYPYACPPMGTMPYTQMGAPYPQMGMPYPQMGMPHPQMGMPYGGMGMGLPYSAGPMQLPPPPIPPIPTAPKAQMQLAHAYVPYQCYMAAFNPLEALNKGTLFPELYMPYKNNKCER